MKIQSPDVSYLASVCVSIVTKSLTDDIYIYIYVYMQTDRYGRYGLLIVQTTLNGFKEIL